MTWYWCLFRTIPESLPWLLSKGRVEEAEAIVKRAARFNNREIPENIFHDHIQVQVPEMKVRYCFNIVTSVH